MRHLAADAWPSRQYVPVGRPCGACMGQFQRLLPVYGLHEAKPLLLLQVLGTATLKNPAPGVNVTLSGTIPDENSGKVCRPSLWAMLCPAFWRSSAWLHAPAADLNLGSPPCSASLSCNAVLLLLTLLHGPAARAGLLSTVLHPEEQAGAHQQPQARHLCLHRCVCWKRMLETPMALLTACCKSI